MITKGQIISFVIVLAVIAFAVQQAILNSNNLKIAKEIAQPAFIAQEPLLATTSGVLSEEIGNTAFFAIDDGAESPKEFVLEIIATTTVLDLLKEACLIVDFAIESKEYEFGVIVEAINNKKNGQDNKYWLYYINGEMPQLTPDKIQPNKNDKIEFKFTSR